MFSFFPSQTNERKFCNLQRMETRDTKGKQANKNSKTQKEQYIPKTIKSKGSQVPIYPSIPNSQTTEKLSKLKRKANEMEDEKRKEDRQKYLIFVQHMPNGTTRERWSSYRQHTSHEVLEQVQKQFKNLEKKKAKYEHKEQICQTIKTSRNACKSYNMRPDSNCDITLSPLCEILGQRWGKGEEGLS